MLFQVKIAIILLVMGLVIVGVYLVTRNKNKDQSDDNSNNRDGIGRKKNDGNGNVGDKIDDKVDDKFGDKVDDDKNERVNDDKTDARVGDKTDAKVDDNKSSTKANVNNNNATKAEISAQIYTQNCNQTKTQFLEILKGQDPKLEQELKDLDVNDPLILPKLYVSREINFDFAPQLNDYYRKIGEEKEKIDSFDRSKSIEQQDEYYKQNLTLIKQKKQENREKRLKNYTQAQIKQLEDDRKIYQKKYEEQKEGLEKDLDERKKKTEEFLKGQQDKLKEQEDKQQEKQQQQEDKLKKEEEDKKKKKEKEEQDKKEGKEKQAQQLADYQEKKKQEDEAAKQLISAKMAKIDQELSTIKFQLQGQAKTKLNKITFKSFSKISQIFNTINIFYDGHRYVDTDELVRIMEKQLIEARLNQQLNKPEIIATIITKQMQTSQSILKNVINQFIWTSYCLSPNLKTDSVLFDAMIFRASFDFARQQKNYWDPNGRITGIEKSFRTAEISQKIDDAKSSECFTDFGMLIDCINQSSGKAEHYVNIDNLQANPNPSQKSMIELQNDIDNLIFENIYKEIELIVCIDQVTNTKEEEDIGPNTKYYFFNNLKIKILAYINLMKNFNQKNVTQLFQDLVNSCDFKLSLSFADKEKVKDFVNNSLTPKLEQLKKDLVDLRDQIWKLPNQIFSDVETQFKACYADNSKKLCIYDQAIGGVKCHRDKQLAAMQDQMNKFNTRQQNDFGVFPSKQDLTNQLSLIKLKPI